MSRKDALVLASRALALLFAVWALGEASYLRNACILSFTTWMESLDPRPFSSIGATTISSR